jgi:succinyl-CoA:(S)-malate CoA-transferase subunit B
VSFACFARIAQAYAGLTYLVGQPNTPPLIAGSTTLADYVSGLYGAYGILLALRVRDRTGNGRYIDIGLHDGMFRFLDELACVYDKTGEVRERMGTEMPAPQRTATIPRRMAGGWVAIA